MAYIPEDAEWYLADILEEHKIEDEPDHIVFSNLVLVRASDPEEAYKQALQLGREREATYLNPERKTVEVHFAGLRDLNVIHDKLEHGAELGYLKYVGVSEDQLRAWATSKGDLGIFKPRDTSYDPPIGRRNE